MAGVKINFDAAAEQRNGKGASAVIMCDHLGRVIDWRCKLWDAIQDPLLLESLACREAVLLGVSSGFTRIVLEGDSSMVIDGLRSRESPIAIQGVFLDVLELTTNCEHIIFSAVRRTANQAAHVIAQKCLYDLAMDSP
ncbi:uncharacterized protein LOC131171158 [Hevea brasiliensis]|uniref:uncharacterized protein LOC131171158 n=1 Tax=Hevea brasiliensis TaxID=3981 RepID=UPI0025D2DC3E|nr:uncharacterized protein LOC131171158 [Hevea brasiliensis]